MASVDSTAEIPRDVRECLLSPHGMVPCQTIAGGLSAARLWMCHSGTSLACLRRWPPEHPRLSRLQFIHQAIEAAGHGGLDFVPRLYRALGSDSYILTEGAFWELSTWMPGSASYLREPSDNRMAAAIVALAQLHGCWNRWKSTLGLAPAFERRAVALANWLARIEAGELWQVRFSDPIVAELGRKTIEILNIHGPQMIGPLRELAQREWLVQPVLRDIRSDHVLFVNDRVGGIIDYGALDFDTPATDLARLLGSLEPSNSAARVRGLELYRQQIECPDFSWETIDLLDQASTILACAQWFEWLVLERREFANEADLLYGRWRASIQRAQSFAVSTTASSPRLWLPT